VETGRIAGHDHAARDTLAGGAVHARA